MSIPTGADYHICAADSCLADVRDQVYRMQDSQTADAINKLAESVEHLSIALAMMQREREKEKVYRE